MARRPSRQIGNFLITVLGSTKYFIGRGVEDYEAMRQTVYNDLAAGQTLKIEGDWYGASQVLKISVTHPYYAHLYKLGYRSRQMIFNPKGRPEPTNGKPTGPVRPTNARFITLCWVRKGV